MIDPMRRLSVRLRSQRMRRSFLLRDYIPITIFQAVLAITLRACPASTFGIFLAKKNCWSAAPKPPLERIIDWRRHLAITSHGTNGDGTGQILEGRCGDDPTLSITTFNVLAPIFKRVGTGRESEFRQAYLERHTAILEHLKEVGSDVICLQELWLAQDEMVKMYQSALEGYRMFTLPRTEARGDGVACFVKEGIEVRDRQDLRLKGLGGRVALILRLGFPGGDGSRKEGQRREVIVANTHLLFPHARTFQILRIREVKKLLAFMECYTQTNDLAHLPVVLCGDFNGRSSGRVYQHLTGRGFRCSYEDTLGENSDRSRWITHVNHLGEQLGVDYIWYRNHDAELDPMEPAWESIVYQSTKRQLLNSYTGEVKQRSLLAEAGGNTTLGEAVVAAAQAAGARTDPGSTSVFEEGQERGASTARVQGADDEDKLSAACQLLGLSEGFNLDEEELKLLLDTSADDFDFLVPTILDGSSSGFEGGAGRRAVRLLPGGCRLETLLSYIRPPALERGVWPEDYIMSDHGSLTAIFRIAAPSDRRSSSVSYESGRLERTLRDHASSEYNDSTMADWEDNEDGHYGLR